MKSQSTFSPVSLRYVAALRGTVPKRAGTEFTYAEAACSNPENLVCLAASNPEGRFYGLVADEAARRAAEQAAALRGTYNVVFLVGKPSEILARIANGSSLPPMLDYLCCDDHAGAFSSVERTALFDLAQLRLKEGGLFATSYAAYDRADGALRFVVRELAPEMNDEQKVEFLSEIKRLSGKFLAQNAEIATKLNDAIIKAMPQSFFSLFDGEAATSATFDTLVAMRSRGMVYAGDAHLTSNYVELAVPVEAQALIVSCRENPLYEPIKDLTLNRLVRSDIWVKAPAAQSTAPGTLFGSFAYGLIVSKEEVPPAYAAQGKAIDLSGALYGKLIDLMSIMPIGVGDALSYSTLKDEPPEKIIEALQILVACGFASPMRGQINATKMTSSAQPRLVGSFNRYLDKTDITDQDVMFASQVVGCGVSVSAREAFVMQALNRAGLDNSVSALMPELRRVANTDAGTSLLHTSEPTQEMAHTMIADIVGKSLPQWYAYAMLEAA